MNHLPQHIETRWKHEKQKRDAEQAVKALKWAAIALAILTAAALLLR